MQLSRRNKLSLAPAQFPAAEPLPVYASSPSASQRIEDSVSPKQHGTDLFLADGKTTSVPTVQPLQLEKPAASSSAPKLRSAEQLRRRAHERATEVIIAGLKALASAAQAQPGDEGQLGILEEFLRYETSCLNDHMRRGQRLLWRASSLQIDLPEQIYNDFAAACWQHVPASISLLLREHGMAPARLARCLGDWLTNMPPSHQQESDAAFLRTLLMPAMEAFAEEGEVELLDAVESSIAATRSQGKKSKKITR